MCEPVVDIPNVIHVGEPMTIIITFQPHENAVSVGIYFWEDGVEHFQAFEEEEDGTWVTSVRNLKEGTVPWELEVDEEVIETGDLNVIPVEDDSSKWPLVLVAILFVGVFVFIEMSFKPGRHRREPEDHDEIPEPEEFKNAPLIDKKDRK